MKFTLDKGHFITGVKPMAVISGIGNVLLTILKWILKIVLGILRLVLEVAKIFLLLLNLVFRVFMAFVSAGTP